MRYLITVLAALSVLAAACDGGTVADDADTGADAVELGSGEGDGPAPAGDDAATTDDGSTGQQDQAAAGGVETVQAGDAGEVDVRIVDGRRLELVEVREADGWTHQVDDLERDEIEIDFRHSDGRTIKLEVELENGQLKVELG